MKKYFITFLFPLLLAVVACGTSHDQRVLPTLFDGPVSFGDGEDFSPDADESVPFEPGEDSEAEEVEEEKTKVCETGSVGVNPVRHDFGLNEMGQRECQNIAINGCAKYSAEIDDASSHSTQEGAPSPSPEFAIFIGDVEAPERLTEATAPELKVCYKRIGVGQHNGRVNIVITRGSSHYSYFVGLTGRTGDKVFQNISKPVDGQLIWEHNCDCSLQGDYFSVPASGSVNGELSSLYTSSNVTITSEGRTTEAAIAADFSFAGEAHVPSTPGIYPVVFSLSTADSSQPSTATRTVIRYTRPDIDLEVRGGGALVNADNETDSALLSAGVIVKNLLVSGPRSEHPVEISLKLAKASGEEWVFTSGEWRQAPDEPEIFNFYTGFEFTDPNPEDEETTVPGQCPAGFASQETTYCFPLPTAQELGRGTSRVTATVCNEFTDYEAGCVVETAEVIVDNGLPKITVYAPSDNRIYKFDDEVVVRGKVENYAPDSTDANGAPACKVKLWLNTPHGQPGIDLCTCPTVSEGSADSLPPCLTIAEGEETDSSTGNRGNIRRGTFEIPLTGPLFSEKLLPYTNLLRIAAENASGHDVIKVISFQRGEYNNSTYTPAETSTSGIITSKIGDLVSGQLGKTFTGNGSTRRAPIMIDIGEDKLQTAEVLAVVKKLLNENLKFADLAMGGGLKKDDDDNVLPIGTGTNEIASDEVIDQMLHSGNAPKQVRALMDFQRRERSTTTYFSAEQAQDLCEQPITTAIITPNVYQYLFPNREPAFLWDEVVGLREWPGVCNDWPENERANCDTTEQGVWDISFDLKDDGFIDATLSLEGVDGKPAFWGHFTAYNLIDEGSTGTYADIPLLTDLGFLGGGTGLADPVIPLLMNVGRLEIRLRDMVRLYKVEKYSSGPNRGKVKWCTSDEGDEEPCACENSNNCTNMLYIYPERVHGSSSAFRFEPYEDCADYFHSKWPGQNLPFGCNEDNEGNFPFTIDTTSPQGYLLWDVVGQQGASSSLLTLIRSVFTNTFKNVVTCAPMQVVNPIIDPGAFPYPEWVHPDDRITDLTLAVGSKNDEIFFKLREDLEAGEEAMFTLTPNIKDADILINDDKLQAKLMATLGATNVQSYSLSSSFFDFGINLPFFGRVGNQTTKREWGHMYRDPMAGFETADRLAGSPSPADLNLSINIEEIAHSATHIIWKKGPLKLLEMLDSQTYADLEPDSNWKLGIDNVIFGRLGICGNLSGGLLDTTLPVGQLFSLIPDEFSRSGALHIDLSLDPNFPPTLALTPVGDIAGFTSVSLLQLGLTNVVVEVKDLLAVEGEDLRYRDPANQPTLIKLRLDGILKVLLLYNKSSRKLDAYVLPYAQQILYTSVLKRGHTYRDSNIISKIDGTLLTNAIGMVAKPFDETNREPTFSVAFPAAASRFDDLTTEHVTIPENGTCNGLTIPLYEGETAPEPEAEPEEEAEEEDEVEEEHCLMEPLGDNNILKNLCELGISEVRFGPGFPDIDFDFANGYLHLSTDLHVDVYDWLWEEVEGE